MRTRLSLLLSTLSVALTVGHSTARAELDPKPVEANECASSIGAAARVVPAPGLRGVRGFDFAELRLVHAERPSLAIEGDAALIAGVSVAIEEGVATLSRGRCAHVAGEIRVTIAAPSFDEIAVTGKTHLSSAGVIRSSGDSTIELGDASRADLSITTSGEVVVFADGGGSHSLALDVGSLVAMHTGSGDVSLKGRARGASLGEMGRGTLATKGLATARLVVDIDGGGTVTALR